MTEAEILEIVLDWLPDADEESTVDGDDDEIPMMDEEDVGDILSVMKALNDDAEPIDSFGF